MLSKYRAEFDKWYNELSLFSRGKSSGTEKIIIYRRKFFHVF
jgi:hypothetical protein